ncbi:MAG: branched-chain alpha-keto acid dehydrogenase subunit E2 [Gemmatimonadetes bacterium]|nr:branched-chain alpha-keto acid dehydrogenase subunit E2 [Gemmatimonadota bacterium]MYD59498.1 branched-chain alpha-keto acid dehydrogenase subunit E2 [Gemmatimonadota bacterium]MYF18137.1 branched-chain alpha-keto acid dehydrogenase subunit E2 [Gemmatimonadota bacterium]
MATEFKLPDLGEGVEAGDVVSVLVAEGDTIEIDQSVVELETDKALVEVPSSVAGTITKIHISAGDRVPVGSLLISVEEGEQQVTADPEPEAEAPAPAPEEKPEPTARAPEPTPPAPRPPAPTSNGDPIPAAPSTRRLARELGVDLTQIAGSGPGGRISQDDIKAAVRDRQTGGIAPTAPVELPDFSRWGNIERQPLSKVRQIIAKNMSQAWQQVAHVTQFDRADVTDLEAFRQRNKEKAEALGAKLTPTVLALKAIITALKTFPQFNASLDAGTNEIILKHYYNLGIAVDTERGLLVPVIKDVDRKDILELALELGDISQRARTSKIGLDELQGGTFTVTNLGSLGVGEFTPIVNHPEVAILGLGRAREEATVREGRIEPRLIMPLALSYDHRVIDGADGARFMRKIVDALENPELMLMGG